MGKKLSYPQKFYSHPLNYPKLHEDLVVIFCKLKLIHCWNLKTLGSNPKRYLNTNRTLSKDGLINVSPGREFLKLETWFLSGITRMMKREIIESFNTYGLAHFRLLKSRHPWLISYRICRGGKRIFLLMVWFSNLISPSTLGVLLYINKPFLLFYSCFCFPFVSLF